MVRADITRRHSELGGNRGYDLAPLFLGLADLLHDRIDLRNGGTDKAAVIGYQHQIGRNQLEEQVFEKASLVPESVGEPRHVCIPG